MIIRITISSKTPKTTSCLKTTSFLIAVYSLLSLTYDFQCERWHDQIERLEADTGEIRLRKIYL
jgi:hypothetical protein